MKYGYLPAPIEEEHHVYGGGHNPQKVVINPTGDYRPYAPAFEPQALKFETWACTVFSILRAIATQYKLLTGKEINFSERAIYILAQIREPGADPHKVAEIIRNNGLIPQDKLPMTDTYAEFITPDPLDVALLILGQQFLNEWEIKHEWVWLDNEPQLNKKNKLKEIMKYGTVCVSVCAWKKSGKFYTKSEFDRDNHFTFLEFIDDKNLNHIFDSYETDHKLLEPDYNFERAKVFFLFKRTEPRDVQKNVYMSILKRLIDFLKELFVLKVEEEKKAIEVTKPIEKPVEKYLWNTKANIRHSIRVLCDEEGLTVEQKNTLCATIQAESQFKIDAKNENKNKQGKVTSTDWGLCQWNDFYHSKEITPDEALNNPEKAVRLMCTYWKQGLRNQWVGYSSGNYKHYL